MRAVWEESPGTFRLVTLIFVNKYGALVQAEVGGGVYAASPSDLVYLA